MVKIYIMKSGAFFIGDKEDDGGMLKNSLEIKFVERRMRDPRTQQEVDAMLPELFPIGFPLNSGVKSLPLSQVIENSWFPMEEDIPLNFVKHYLDKVAELSPIKQPKGSIIV